MHLLFFLEILSIIPKIILNKNHPFILNLRKFISITIYLTIITLSVLGKAHRSI